MRSPLFLSGPAHGLPASSLLAVLAWSVFAASGCEPDASLQLYVAGFPPERVRFELDDRGRLPAAERDALANDGSVDARLFLPPGSCDGPCRVVVVSLHVENTNPEPEAPPVVRFASPEGRPARLPVVFTGQEISPGRVGRLRFVLELWPEEKRVDATLSASVRVDVNTAPPPSNPPPSNPPPPSTPPLETSP